MGKWTRNVLPVLALVALASVTLSAQVDPIIALATKLQLTILTVVQVLAVAAIAIFGGRLMLGDRGAMGGWFGLAAGITIAVGATTYKAIYF